MATKFTSTELDYIYHGFDNMVIDPRLLFQLWPQRVLDISDIFNDLRHDQLVDICEDLLPSEYMDEDDYEEPDNLDDGVLCGRWSWGTELISKQRILYDSPRRE